MPPSADSISDESQGILTQFAHALQEARATDLQDYAEDFTDDTYRLDYGLFYWPAGEPGCVDDLPYFTTLSPRERRLVHYFEDNHPYTFLATGTGRAVFTSDTHDGVIKFGRWGPGSTMGNGVNQNIVERNIYNSLKNETDALLPITDSDDNGNWILQPRADLLNDIPEDDRPTYHEAISNVRERLGPFADLIHDENDQNIGRWMGDWYIIDYARLH